MRALAAAALVVLLGAAASPDFQRGGTVVLGSIIDGDTLALTDGRTLRLASIDTPDAAPARAALEKMLAGKTLTLRFAGNATDRNGHVVAELYANGRWVQRALVRRGFARVHGAADNRIGLPELLAVEDQARQAKHGLWRLRRYAVRDADDAARDAGTWQIVEGTVVDAAPVEGGLYLNFAADWKSGFSIHLGRDALKLAREAGLDPKALAGAKLRVRGFVDGTRRPTIEVSFPEQIERLE
jgi:endonuclease YncB( thermonuclease family)